MTFGSTLPTHSHGGRGIHRHPQPALAPTLTQEGATCTYFIQSSRGTTVILGTLNPITPTVAPTPGAVHDTTPLEILRKLEHTPLCRHRFQILLDQPSHTPTSELRKTTSPAS